MQPSSDSDPADRILDGESGQDGEGAPFLPPIPEQEGVAPDEVIPTGPGSEGYAAVATRDPNEEKQAEPQRPNYSAVSEGSPDLGSSEDTSDPRQREEELSAKIRPKAKPLRLPKVCTTTKHMQIFPPSHPIPSLLGMVSCFWIDGFHPTCGGQEVRRGGVKYVELFLSDSCSVQFSADHPATLLYVHVPVGEEAHPAGGRLHRSHAPEQVCYHRGGASLCIGGSATDHSKKTRHPDRAQPTVGPPHRTTGPHRTANYRGDHHMVES